jgi:aspartyl aminopeptidase
MQRKSSELIRGEELNLLVSGIPLNDPEATGRFKLGLLQLLNERYQIKEADLVTAELEIIPAVSARDIGFDRSMIGAYGHDDRACAFPALVALSRVDRLERTGVALLFDKEEIGSVGNTGANSRVYEHFLYELYARTTDNPDLPGYHALLENSRMLSGDVTNAYDPTFASVSDSRNNAYLGRGINFMKFRRTHRRKSGSSDDSAEFYAAVISLMGRRTCRLQAGELGKVDDPGVGVPLPDSGEPTWHRSDRLAACHGFRPCIQPFEVIM